ncbi:MarR family winged helix-turn-helix transcriptional regulator [Aminivibrio pyruvatiphilus]|nr:MarR family transcriptional regulator [Aminivibrio pyruvatiphilus]
MEKTQQIIRRIGGIHDSIHRFISGYIEQCEKECLVPSHGELLTALFSGREFTMGDLAREIRKTKPTVTVLVEKLVRCGYVIRERDARDGRISYIRLTEKGWGLKPVLEDTLSSLEMRLFSGFTVQEKNNLEEMLFRIEENSKEEKRI